ncbi:MAG: ATP-binding protein [Thermoplasmatota archaeon]
MKISVASGKGGTGKTTIAVNLALSIENAMLIDCDVEGPNSHLFIKGGMKKLKDVSIPAPRFDTEKCTLCGKCADLCQYNAISIVGEKLLFFEELCHGCGGCRIICPVNAVTEVDHHIGIIEKGEDNNLPLYHGKLDISEPFGVPIIRELQGLAEEDRTIIFDSPPGTACPAVETMRAADVCILVTEPTPFGLHDLQLTMDVMKEIGTPYGVVINRDGIGDDRVEEFCRKEGIPVLMKIENDMDIARAYSKGIPIVEAKREYRELFRELYIKAREMLK